MKQSPWGQQSSTRLKQLLPVGQGMTLRAVETDKYKRLVAEVFVDNRSVNLNMVQEGQAVVYRQYLKGCRESKDSLLQGENTAKQQRLAFWSQANPVMPWDFRHKAAQRATSQAIQHPIPFHPGRPGIYAKQACHSPSLPLPISFDGYKSKSRLNVSPSESSSSSVNEVAVLEESLLSSVLVGVKATCCVGNAPFLKAKW
ncbi:thermonuclease family protein [Nostoc sp. 'Peltigera membranacea cyanobiont' 232]|uniref:thermonuclease family protein n=1 Tax=Nostoc sp. 'Peltigera membranacea cyanobiont' 232 TaxID=2014531 RepID=UPI0021D5268F|nr:thermonuclease family protein [Nostoc sp. 'Peltigera membranacea cyanobiont' 232]